VSRNFSKQLACQIGESLVVSELGRRGIVATSFSGNLPDIDLLAYKNGSSLALQVKAWRGGSVSFDAKRFLEISLNGNVQKVEGFVSDLNNELRYVFVKIGKAAGEDRFFVLTQRDLARIVRRGYESFLQKHHGVRPRNPSTTHNAVTEESLAKFEDNWDLIELAFPED